MFKELFNFGFKRTSAQAFGFYIAWVVLIALAGGAVSAVLGAVFLGGSDSFSTGFQFGERVGGVVAILMCTAVAITVIAARKKTKSFGAWIAVLFAAFLSVFGGALLGVIPIAYLSTL